MPVSPCSKRKHNNNNSCKCRSSCNNCECIAQREQCPPTSEEEEGPVFYTPVIAAAPAPKKCCCTKCCEVKQKKSLWQQLFGERKCCSPCQKKKQECLCKQKKKQRCVSECTNQPCCNGYKPTPPPAPKPCKPCCCCKVKTCNVISKPYPISKPCCPISKLCCPTPKPCCPIYKTCVTPSSLFGCHFYCNVENQGNRTKQSQCQCCCCTSSTSGDERNTSNDKISSSCEQRKTSRDKSHTSRDKSHTSRDKSHTSKDKRKSIHSETDDERVTKTTSYTNNKSKVDSRRKTSFQDEPVKQEPVERPPQRKKQTVDKPTRSNIHIGLTLTNTETKYYKKNNSCPPNEEEKYDRKYENEGSNGSCEKIITLEIHQSDGKRDQEENKKRESNQNRDVDTLSSNSSRRRKLSTVREENEKHSVKSESCSREIQPPTEKRSSSRGSFIENKTGNESPPSKKREKGISKRQEHEKSEDGGLDQRVSEILRRLRNIESKINLIDPNQTENKHIKIDIDDNKSTISFHFEDGKHYDDFDNNNNRSNNNDKNSREPAAVIYIRQTRSKSCSPVRKTSSEEINKKYRNSQSLDRGTRAKHENPKLVIKLPHGNKVSHGVVSVNNSNRTKHISRDYNDSEWMEISNELKNRNQSNKQCYCYECVCKRARCK